MSDTVSDRATGKDFIRTIVERHLEEGRYDGVVTRFPPEPNGYLHIGHAKAICLDFGIAEEYGGRCHLRFDDTNPLTEEEAYTRAMMDDIRWLGFDWGDHVYHASDYFPRLLEFAIRLIEKGRAYVDSQSEEEIRENRGSITEAGTNSPFRGRSVEENLDLFRRMKEGEFAEGEHVLRAKIDMAHLNMIMRDPILYRILHASHYRTGDAWCIYPLYDFAHCLEDAIEEVTHSFCTLEFDNNREIYDWLLDEVGFAEPRPHQYEFARLNLEYTILSKRMLVRLVREGHVDGWNDPRMPTIAGMRRRGIPPEAIRELCDMVGVTKAETRVDIGKLEYAIRDSLNPVAPRVMAVLRPLKVVLTNYREGTAGEVLDAPYYPRDIDRGGSRPLPFGRELLVERSDFAVDPPKGWKRLAPGRSVRLRHAYVITVEEVVEDAAGEPVEIRARYHPESLGVNPEGVKVSGVVHWVAADGAVPATVRLVDRLFRVPEPDRGPEGHDFVDELNPDSLVVLEGALVEPSVLDDPPETRYQFERTGYFVRDREDSEPDALVFNRIVSLRDSWEKVRDTDGRDRVAATDATREDSAPAPVGPEDRVSDERRAAREADPALAARFDHYRESLGLSLDDADVLTGSHRLADFFDGVYTSAAAVMEARPEPEEAVAAAAREAAAWVVNEVMRELKDRALDGLPFSDIELGRLVAMVEEGEISRIAAKEVFAEMVRTGRDPREVVRERGLEKVDDPAELEPVVARLIARHRDKVEAYRAGKTGLLGFFVGQAMRETGGSADPRLVKRLFELNLGAVDGEG